MGTPVCAGCGKTLPPPTGRGRPATYHGPACRQRARRARLAANPDRSDLLTLLDRASQAVAAARRAAISGHNPAPALAEPATVAEIVAVGHVADNAPGRRPTAEHSATDPVELTPVTHSVTEPIESQVRPATSQDLIDVDTVHVERSEDFEISGTYRALAGDSLLLGYLERDGRRRWQARTATTAVTVPGGPWRTRQDALVGLLLNGSIRTYPTARQA